MVLNSIVLLKGKPLKFPLELFMEEDLSQEIYEDMSETENIKGEKNIEATYEMYYDYVAHLHKNTL